MKRTVAAVVTAVASLTIVGVTQTAASAAGGTTLIADSFTGPTTIAATWVTPSTQGAGANRACLTGGTIQTTTSTVPACASSGGASGLELTDNNGSEEGALGWSASVPTSLGLDATFNTYQFGGDGADGIAFFMAASDPTNSSASPITLGPAGGDFGYSADRGAFANTTATAPGMTNGYLGVGLDAFGNFGNPQLSGTGCSNEPTAGPGVPAVDVRGPGAGIAGYCILSAQAATDPTTGLGTLRTDNDTPVAVEVAINPTTSSLQDAGGFIVAPSTYAVRVTPPTGPAITEVGPLPNATAFLPASWVDGNGVPKQLTFGWTGSTGASDDYHVVSNAAVSTLIGTPPALGVTLSDNSTATTHTGQTVNYSAVASVTAAAEGSTLTLTDTFPTQLTPGAASGTGWTCGTTGQKVTCTYPGGIPKGTTLPTVTLPAVVAIPAGSQPVQVVNTVNLDSDDGTPATASDTDTFSARTATALTVEAQPVDTVVNTPMTNPDGSTTQIQIAATNGAGGAVDTGYTGPVTLGFGANPGNALFVVPPSTPNGPSTTSPTLTVNAVAGVATFSPVTINAVGFDDTLVATAPGLASATTASFDVAAAATDCTANKSCTVTTTSTATGQSALVTAAPGPGTVVTASFGGPVAPIHPCNSAIAGVLTFNGNRQKTVALTIQTARPILIFCYGQPTPFVDITLRKTTFFNQVNQEYEGVLGPCLGKIIPPPCISGLSFNRGSETVTVTGGPGDPKLSH